MCVVTYVVSYTHGRYLNAHLERSSPVVIISLSSAVIHDSHSWQVPLDTYVVEIEKLDSIDSYFRKF